MPTSPPGNEPGSPSGSDVAESEKSDSSSSDFEIQAVTSADGVRKESLVAETEQSKKDDENAVSHQESKPVKRPSNATNGTHSDLLGLGAYTDSSSSDDDQISIPAPRQGARGKKRVRFADDPPEKKQRLEQRISSANISVNGHLGKTVEDEEDEEDEATVLSQLAEFEAAVADAGRDTDDIEADLVDTEDAREEEKQRELENTVKRLREEFMRRKERAKVKDGK